MAYTLLQSLKLLSYSATTINAWLQYRKSDNSESARHVTTQTAIISLELVKEIAKSNNIDPSYLKGLQVANIAARFVDIAQSSPPKKFSELSAQDLESLASKVIGVCTTVLETKLLSIDLPNDSVNQSGSAARAIQESVVKLRELHMLAIGVELSTRNGLVSSALTTSSDKEEASSTITPASPVLDENSEEPLAGMSSKLEELYRVIQPPGDVKEIRTYNLFGVEPERGLLLYGPPGTGKTTLAKHLLRRIGCAHVKYISSVAVKDKWYGKTEANIRVLFAPAQEAYHLHGDNAPLHAIIIDELEGILARRTHSGENPSERHDNGVVDQFLEQLNLLATLPNLIVIGITNHKDDIDPAILRSGRLGYHVHIDLPNIGSRKEIFEHYIMTSISSKVLGDVDLDQLAELSDSLSGADIKAVIRRVRQDACHRAIQQVQANDISSGGALISQDDLVQGLEQFLVASGLGSMRSLGAEISQCGMGVDVGGLGEQLETLRREILILRTPNGRSLANEYGLRVPKGVLLYGPPGTGKTTLAGALARELNCDERHMKFVAGPDLIGQRMGETESNIRKLFEPALASYRREKEEAPLHVIMIEEMEGVVGCRTPFSAAADNRSVDQFLNLLDGGEAIPNVLVIGITNHKSHIDPAILRPGRLGLHLYIGLPDLSARQDIFRIHLRQTKERGLLAEPVDTEALAASTEGFSGAQIADVVRKAKTLALRRTLSSVNGGVDLEEREIASSVNQEDMINAIQDLLAHVDINITTLNEE